MKANPARRMLDGVLREGSLKIAVKTKAFPTTAIGEKRPTTAEVHIKNALTAVAILWRLVKFLLQLFKKILKSWSMKFTRSRYI